MLPQRQALLADDESAVGAEELVAHTGEETVADSGEELDRAEGDIGLPEDAVLKLRSATDPASGGHDVISMVPPKRSASAPAIRFHFFW